eukprot:TRINITY_DN2034_c2_g1_i1.p1 TRINITY_DN2034_c2_g1~~TRINITY_DN2034_c2_g1_i1.p1  ORF type:complete len:652 (+),score=165.41 TRINITY_DN2034_c2_g1_i1:41-1957(+)
MRATPTAGVAAPLPLFPIVALLLPVVVVVPASALPPTPAPLAAKEEVTGDMLPYFRSTNDRKVDRYIHCRVWLGNATTPTPAWQPEELEVVTFSGPESIGKHFEAHPDDACKMVHISRQDLALPEPRWLLKSILELRGFVEGDLFVEDVFHRDFCKDLQRAKLDFLIERERCRSAGHTEYKWCRCRSGRHAPKNLICVPPTHLLQYESSPLLDGGKNSMVCLFRLSYKPQHNRRGTPVKVTPHRPYPTLDRPVSTAVLAYVNTQRLLEGTAQTFRTWVPHFFIPQNADKLQFRTDLFAVREVSRREIQVEDIVKAFALHAVQGERATWRKWAGGGSDNSGVFGSPRYATSVSGAAEDSFGIFIGDATEGYPPGLDSRELTSVRPRCGCPPLCAFPTKRSPDAFLISSLRYVQGTSVFTWELFSDPRMKEYDFLVKLDWDIRFFRPYHTPLMRRVVESGAWGFHTGFANNGNGCSRDAQRAFDGYARSRGEVAQSAGDWLYENEQTAWHSALFGIWTGLVMSPEYRGLMDFLRNSDYGYSWFRYRWTDQSVWPKLVGYFHKDLKTAMLDFRHLRWNPNAPRPKSIFYHRKKRRHDSEVCCGSCADGVERACYKHRVKSPYVQCHTPPEADGYNISYCER